MSGGTADIVLNFGPKNSNWKPCTGDWNGNVQATVGLFNPDQSKLFLKNSTVVAGPILPLALDQNSETGSLSQKIGTAMDNVTSDCMIQQKAGSSSRLPCLAVLPITRSSSTKKRRLVTRIW